MTTAPHRAPGGFPIVGIIGGGQLARMCAGPATELGITLSVLAEAADSSAAQVIPSAPVADCADIEAALAFARDCDVVTFDHEQVPPEVIDAIIEAGTTVHPNPSALTFAQDKLAMRARLSEMGMPCPRWRPGASPADLTEFAQQVGWPVVVKTPRGGYDGNGVAVVSSADEVADWFRRASAEGRFLLLEERVDFARELAIVVARSPSGQAAAWPVVETVQTGGICTEVLAPAPELSEELAVAATEAALRIAGELEVTGVMAVELFQVGESFLINELAMRPHNSGHWSMDGAVTGQFEQHLRAVLDLPLGSPKPRAEWTVMANVLGGEQPELYSAYRHVMARDPSAKVHLYGKAVRPGRKIGHVTVCGVELGGLRARARHAADYIQGAIDE